MQTTLTARQGGWSMFTLSIALAVAVLFFMVGLAMYPGYYEAFAVRKAINSLAEDISIGTMAKPTIWGLLEKRFDMSGLYTPTPTKENLVVEYDYKAPLFYNISILMHFKHEILVEGP